METKSNELLNKINHRKFDLLADYATLFNSSDWRATWGAREDYEKFLYWSHAIVKMYDKVSDENASEAEAAAKDFYIYMSDLIDEKNNNPQNDMISELSQVSENNQQLTKDQIICTVILLKCWS